MNATALHPLVAAAAEGRLPSWAEADDARRAHMARVADLLDGWAAAEGLDGPARVRRRALGYLHDALKDADAAALREIVPAPLAALPEPVLHGPAVAARLEHEGVDDTPFLDALRWHTLGHPVLDRAGRSLYAADFLEPGRDIRNAWRAGLRARMPDDVDRVLVEIVGARLGHLLEHERPIRPETLAFWNRLTEGDAWARASEV